MESHTIFAEEAMLESNSETTDAAAKGDPVGPRRDVDNESSTIPIYSGHDIDVRLAGKL